jgi:hypothetical protein
MRRLPGCNVQKLWDLSPTKNKRINLALLLDPMQSTTQRSSPMFMCQCERYPDYMSARSLNTSIVNVNIFKY